MLLYSNKRSGTNRQQAKSDPHYSLPVPVLIKHTTRQTELTYLYLGLYQAFGYLLIPPDNPYSELLLGISLSLYFLF